VPQDSDQARDAGNENPLESDEGAAVAAKALRSDLTRSTLFPLYADRALARAGAWYEIIPRSQGRIPGRHGTFDDCIARLPDIAALGFDVV
jgi:starch synthase (maltosyl-transferring)